MLLHRYKTFNLKSHTEFTIARIPLWEKARMEIKVHLNSFSSFIKSKNLYY